MHCKTSKTTSLRIVLENIYIIDVEIFIQILIIVLHFYIMKINNYLLILKLLLLHNKSLISLYFNNLIQLSFSQNMGGVENLVNYLHDLVKNHNFTPSL